MIATLAFNELIPLQTFQNFSNQTECLWSQSHFICGIIAAPISFKVVSTQPAFTCSKLTIETLEQGVKYVQS